LKSLKKKNKKVRRSVCERRFFKMVWLGLDPVLDAEARGVARVARRTRRPSRVGNGLAARRGFSSNQPHDIFSPFRLFPPLAVQIVNQTCLLCAIQEKDIKNSAVVNIEGCKSKKPQFIGIFSFNE